MNRHEKFGKNLNLLVSVEEIQIKDALRTQKAEEQTVSK
jgi:hypothetical protein